MRALCPGMMHYGSCSVLHHKTIQTQTRVFGIFMADQDSLEFKKVCHINQLCLVVLLLSRVVNSYIPKCCSEFVHRSHSGFPWCSVAHVSSWFSCLCTQTQSAQALDRRLLSLAFLPTSFSFTSTADLSGFSDL